MIRSILGIVAAVGLGGAATAGVVPSIVDSDAVVLFYGPDLGFSVIGENPTANFDPAPEFASVNSTPGGGAIDLTVEGPGSILLSAAGAGYTTSATGIIGLLQTVSDATGLFGPLVRFTIGIVNFDPSATYQGTANLTIEGVPAPIPLPAGALLLIGALAVLRGVRRHRAAA